MDWTDLEPGATILKAEPFAHVAHDDLKVEVCDACMSNEEDLVRQGVNLRLCGACKSVRYCNRSCQREAWSEHKIECKYLAKVGRDGNSARLFLRILAKLQKHDKQRFDLPTGKKVTLNELSSLPDYAYNLLLDYMPRCHGFCEWLESEALGTLSPGKMSKIFALLAYNQVPIKNEVEVIQGYGIYFVASEFEHSCQPNSVFIFNGKSLEARYLGPDKLAGPIRTCRTFTVSRVNFLWDTPTRQKYLKENSPITCKCLKCQLDPIEVDSMKQGCLKCPECAGPISASIFMVPGSSGQLRCPNCQHQVSSDTLGFFWILKRMLKRISIVCQVNEADLNFYPVIGQTEFNIIVKAERIVHCYDLDFFYCLNGAAGYGLFNGHHDIALGLCLKILQTCNRYLFVPTLLTLTAHMRIIYLARITKDELLLTEHIEKAKNLASILYGENHPLYKKLVRL